MSQQAQLKFVRGGAYNWKGQADRLIYLGKVGSWDQFKHVQIPIQHLPPHIARVSDLQQPAADEAGAAIAAGEATGQGVGR